MHTQCTSKYQEYTRQINWISLPVIYVCYVCLCRKCVCRYLCSSQPNSIRSSDSPQQRHIECREPCSLLWHPNFLFVSVCIALLIFKFCFRIDEQYTRILANDDGIGYEQNSTHSTLALDTVRHCHIFNETDSSHKYAPNETRKKMCTIRNTEGIDFGQNGKKANQKRAVTHSKAT